MAKYQPAFGVMRSMNFENIGTAYLGGFMKERSKMNNTLRQLAMGVGGLGGSAARAAQTRANAKYDSLLKERRAAQRELADINKVKRGLEAGGDKLQAAANNHARLRLQEYQRRNQRNETRREREIAKADANQVRRDKVIGKAKDTNRLLDTKIEAALNDAGIQNIRTPAQWKIQFDRTPGKQKQMKSITKAALLTHLFTGKSPGDEIFEGSGITEEQFVDSYIKDVLQNQKSTPDQLGKLISASEGITRREKSKAQKLSNSPLSDEELFKEYREEYLAPFKDRDQTELNTQEADLKTRIQDLDTQRSTLLESIGTPRVSADPYGNVQLSSEYDLPASMMDELFYVPGRREVPMSDPTLLDDVDEIAMEKDFDPTLGLGRARVELGGGQISDTVEGQRPERMRGVGQLVEPVYGELTGDETDLGKPVDGIVVGKTFGPSAAELKARGKKEEDDFESKQGELNTVDTPTPTPTPTPPEGYVGPKDSGSIRQETKMSALPGFQLTDPTVLDGQNVLEAYAELLGAFGEKKPNLVETALDKFRKKGKLSNTFRFGGQSQQDRSERAVTEAAIRREIDEEQGDNLAKSILDEMKARGVELHSEDDIEYQMINAERKLREENPDITPEDLRRLVGLVGFRTLMGNVVDGQLQPRPLPMLPGMKSSYNEDGTPKPVLYDALLDRMGR